MSNRDSRRIVQELGVRATRERLVRVAAKVLSDQGESEDAAHDAVIQALRAADSFRDEAQVTTWLHRVAVNAALMRLRKRKRAAKRVTETESGDLERVASVSPDADALPGPGALCEAKQQAERVRAAVDDLPPLYRDVIRLVVFEEAPLDEAARALGLTPSAVRTRMGRARAQLREKLAA